MSEYRFDYECLGCHTRHTIRKTTIEPIPGEEVKNVDACCISKKLIVIEVWVKVVE